MGYCENRVAIVTGAGGGLGRAYAKRLAAEGASVIVNDINPETAASCVEEIKAEGGQALIDTHNITDYEEAAEIIKAALDSFGDLHAIVNNAGNNRDRMFTSLSPEDWDAVMAVHLKGHFCLSSHAAKLWRGRSKNGEAVSGRIINTSSGAGLQGSVAQSNYSAAKAGILALTLVQSAELARYGITVNAIAPQGRTGMTAGVFDEMMKPPKDGGFDVYDPANVAPLIAWLVSENSSHITGQCFELYGGKLSIAQGWKTGAINDKGAQWQPEELGAAIDQLIADGPPAQPVYGSS